MPSSSKQQQKFMGMVHALQKGDMKQSDASAELKRVAKDMNPSDVKDYASTKHTGLPKRVKVEIVKRLKEYAMMLPNHQTKLSTPADSLRSDDDMDIDTTIENINHIANSINEKLDTDLEKKYGITLDIYEYPDYLDLTRIIVPKDKRGEGIGTKVMNDIISYAKKNKKDIFLTPSSDFGGSKGRLIQFYKSFGFKDNKGKNRDFRSRESMKLTMEAIEENFPANWMQGRVSDQHTKLGTTPREKYDDANFDKDDSGQNDLGEAYNKGEIFGGKIKIGGVAVPLEVELIGADNKKNVFITKVVHIDSKYHSKLPSNGILEIPARIFRTPGGGWYKVKTKSAFEGITNEHLSDNEREMVVGIIDILKQVKDSENRKEIALSMIKQFKEENIDFDYSKFLSQLKEYGSNSTDTFLLPRHSDKLAGTPEETDAIDRDLKNINESWTVKDGSVLSNGKLIGYYDFDRDSDSFWVDDVKKGKGQLSFDTKKEVENYFKKNEKDAIKHLQKLRESTNPSDIIKDLDKVRHDLIKKVDVLITKKKKLYSNVDIESPMSADEKQLDKDIQSIFSQIQQLIQQKRKIKTESITEVAFGDWHFKAIQKLYQKAGSFGRKKIAAVITANPNSNWDKIAKELKYSDYEEVTEYTDRLGLTEIVEALKKKNK